MLRFAPPVPFFSRVVPVVAILIGLGLAADASHAQTPVTKVKDSNGNVLFQIIQDGGLVAYEAGASGIPATGAGTRMMWYPAKAAFRAGIVGGEAGKEDVWNADNVGGASVAFGRDTRASGGNSTALGKRTTATGAEAVAMGVETIASGGNAIAIGENTTSSANGSVAMGTNSLAEASDAVAMGGDTKASGGASVAMGLNTIASDAMAVAMGFDTEASGRLSVSMGRGTTSKGLRTVTMGGGTTASTGESLSIGRCNNSNTSEDGTLFVVGNGNYPGGSSCDSRSDALRLDDSGDMKVDGTVTAESHNTSSDRRLKTDIQELDSVLDELETVDPVRFHFKEDTGHPQDRQIGLIAQEVQKNFPELVSKGSDGYLSLAYPKLTAVLLKGLQEQQAIIDNQSSEIKTLKAENDAIKKRLAAVEQKVSGESDMQATMMSSWTLVFLLGLGLGGVLGVLVRRESGRES